MEVAGVVLGAVALVGVFEDCITLFSQIGAAKSQEKDYILLVTKLDLEKALLLQWAERMKIHDKEKYDPRLNEATIALPIHKTLDCIRQLLQDGDILQRQYGVRAAEAIEATEPCTTASSGVLSRLRDNSLTLQFRSNLSNSSRNQSKLLHRSSDVGSKTKRSRSDVESTYPHQAELSHQGSDEEHKNKRSRHGSHVSQFDHPNQQSYDNRRSKISSAVGKIKWVIRDKEQFDSLVRKLSELISGIDRLVPAQGGDMPMSDNSKLIDITKRAIDEVCIQLIHDRLWFRLIDDRKNSINDAHSRTFEWSIHPPTSGAVWDDLNGWLRSGRHIYWIHGKPGSGKSTLMVSEIYARVLCKVCTNFRVSTSRNSYTITLKSSLHYTNGQGTEN